MDPQPDPPSPLRTAKLRALCLVTGSLLCCATCFDTPVTGQEAINRQGDEPGLREPVTEEQPREPATEEQVEQWVEMLGSRRFAQREKAAMELLREGETILPQLQRLSNSHSDPEIRLRTAELAKQIGRGDLESRVAAFLAGKSDNLDGWSIAQRVLGDTNSVRELYVELVKAHPDIALSLEGTSRDRVIAMDAAAARVRRANQIERRFPTRADAVALLFPLIFEGVPIASDYERLLISVLRTQAGSSLYQDPRLSAGYQRLFGGWARRSGIANREEMLFLLMSHDVPQTLAVALDTLSKTNDPETLATALKAIARFGDRRQAALITNLLHDDRPVLQHGFNRGRLSRTELGDVAMATLAMLYDIPLAEVGFDGATEDPKFGFQVEELGFPIDDTKNRRAKSKKKVIAAVAEKNNANAKRDPAPLLVE